jgi:small-conductance mechanosensitive channel
LLEIAKEQPMVLANPAPSVLFVNIGASSFDFEIRMFLRDVNWMMAVKSDVNHAIARRFAEAGIEMPYPQQDIWFRNPETMQAPKPAAQEKAAPKKTRADKSTDIPDKDKP